MYSNMLLLVPIDKMHIGQKNALHHSYQPDEQKNSSHIFVTFGLSLNGQEITFSAVPHLRNECQNATGMSGKASIATIVGLCRDSSVHNLC